MSNVSPYMANLTAVLPFIEFIMSSTKDPKHYPINLIHDPNFKLQEGIFDMVRQKSKLANLKSTLLSKLREDRVERFKDEQRELQAAAENDENYYLDQMNEEEKKLEEQMKRLEEIDEHENIKTDSESDDESSSDDTNPAHDDAERSDDEIRTKRKKHRNRRMLESSDSDGSDVEENPVSIPFQDQPSDSNQESRLSNNPYVNMSRTYNQPQTNQMNTPVTPDRSQHSSRSSSFNASTSPYRYDRGVHRRPL